MKKLLAVLALVAGVVPHAAAFPGGEARLAVDKVRYRTATPVTITFDNASGEAIAMSDRWSVRDVRTGDVVATHAWSEDQLTVAPDETRTWVWNQVSGCHGACPEPQPGAPVWQIQAGVYEAIVPTDQGELRARFQTGEYFTIGFTSRPGAKFIVYVNRPEDVTEMRAEAETDDTEKQIVSGIVRRAKRYNPDWNFTMAPGSIVLGDMFIEVCDGSPYYVQRHRSEWLGQRWCPWSSYVEKVGR